jgi:acyl-CoA synthetase (NDP forming)
MTFIIDTGTPEDRTTLEYAVRNYVADWFQDQCLGLTPQQTARAYSEQIISEVQTPVKADTARKHLVSHWQFLRSLAEHDPAAFDHIILSYAERA